MKLVLGKKLIAAFSLAVVVLVVINIVSRGSAARLLATAGWVTHSHEVVAKLETVSHWVERAETAQRDFLILGEASYLAPYDSALRAIDQTGGELRALTTDNPSQQLRLFRLLALIHARRDEINESIALRREHGELVRLPEVVTGAGADTANAIHDVIGEMEQEEQGLLRLRIDEANQSARWIEQLIMIANLLALILVVLSVWAIYRDILRRERAEASLRESELRYRSVISALSEGIVLQDSTGVIQACNRSAERILGLPADQMIGRTSVDPRWQAIREDGSAFPVEEHPTVVTLSTGRSCTDVVMGVYQPDGALKWVSVNSDAIFQGQRTKPRAVVCSFTDITERKRTEEALRSAEQRFRTLVEQLPAIIYVAALDATSSTIYTSPQIESMLGFSQDEWMADDTLWRQRIHPDDYARVMEDVKASQATGAPVPSEYRMLTRSGKTLWFRDQGVIIHDQAGQPLFMQGVMFDITERKLAEAALRVSEARNRALLDALPDSMFRLSRDGVYLDVHTNRTTDLVLPPDRLLGKNVSEVMPSDVAIRVLAGIDRALQTEVVQLIEYQLVLEQAPRDFEARVVVCAEHEVLAIVRDITDRKNIERLKNEFVSTVSHELRTPLTSIRGSLGLILGSVSGDIPPKARAMVEIAAKNSERLIRLINDILDIDKIESGKMVFDFQPVELVPLLEHAIDINRAYGQQFDISFTMESSVANAWVYADSDRLIQALTNLLSNAAKFSPIGAPVHLSLDRRGEMLRIAIRDRGPGIPEAFRARLFQRFAQADASDARQKGGTGLGLSITKAIVEKLGGQIDVMIVPDAGSTFFIDLPEWYTLDLTPGHSRILGRLDTLGHAAQPDYYENSCEAEQAPESCEHGGDR